MVKEQVHCEQEVEGAETLFSFYSSLASSTQSAPPVAAFLASRRYKKANTHCDSPLIWQSTPAQLQPRESSCGADVADPAFDNAPDGRIQGIKVRAGR